MLLILLLPYKDTVEIVKIVWEHDTPYPACLYDLFKHTDSLKNKISAFIYECKSVNVCSEVKWASTDFPCSGSREQRTLCREHVNRNTVHSSNSLLMSWLWELGVLTKRDMQICRAGVVRTGIGNRWATTCIFIALLVKVLQFQEGRSGCWCLSVILALSAQRTWTRWWWRIVSARTGCAEVCWWGR